MKQLCTDAVTGSRVHVRSGAPAGRKVRYEKEGETCVRYVCMQGHTWRSSHRPSQRRGTDTVHHTALPLAGRDGVGGGGAGGARVHDGEALSHGSTAV